MKMDQIFEQQPIIIALDIDALLFDKIERAANAGYSVIEINNIDAFMLERVLTDFPQLKIGVGNVISSQQLEDAHQAGAHFVTSPGFLPTLVQTAQIYSIQYVPGIATLSEAMHAFSLNCRLVRPYPASLSICTVLSKYLPLLQLLPAEIELDEAEHFLSLPAVKAVSVINPEMRMLVHS